MKKGRKIIMNERMQIRFQKFLELGPIQVVLKILFILWPVILAISAIVGIIAFLFRGDKVKEIFSQTPMKVFSVILIIFLALSGAVNFFCADVPDVTGMSLELAVKSLRDSKLTVRLEPGNLWEPKTMVSKQDVEQGTILRKKDIVNLGLVNAIETEEIPGELVNVPHLVGMEQNEAARLLVENRLTFQVWWTEDENFTYSDVYYIKSQNFNWGDAVYPGTGVRLELTSTKPENALVP